MIFNSIAFLVFIGIFLPIYFNLKERGQIWLCLVGSYFFYGWWDWRFLSLIMFSTCIDYFVGLKMQGENDQAKRKQLLIISMVVNLGFLAFFKYFNFFIGSFDAAMQSVGVDVGYNTLNIVLPVGISFYTFQSMSYTIDVYFKKIKVEPDFVKFATFISFFPQLVAGPIVRAIDFLPQFSGGARKFNWDRITSGLGQMLWGFFKKVAVADSLAPFVDQCFAAPEGFSSLHLIIGIIFYSFQIYCDFSGYSDIAIGLARILGFDFPDNFKTPYFSRNFSEFWTRWHISLSSWLRDYLYIPLGGNRGGGFGSYFFTAIALIIPVFLSGWYWLILVYGVVFAFIFRFAKKDIRNKVEVFTYMNLVITMFLGGLWHGASWAFAVWGYLHGTYLIVQRLIGPYYKKFVRTLRIPRPIVVAGDIAMVYFFTCLAWVFFRAKASKEQLLLGIDDFDIANQYIAGIAAFDGMSFATVINKFMVAKGVILIATLLFVEIADFKFDFSSLIKTNPVFRVISFAAILWVIAFFGSFGANSFIYFQF